MQLPRPVELGSLPAQLRQPASCSLRAYAGLQGHANTVDISVVRPLFREFYVSHPLAGRIVPSVTLPVVPVIEGPPSAVDSRSPSAQPPARRRDHVGVAHAVG